MAATTLARPGVARWPALGTTATVAVTQAASLPAARATVLAELDRIDRAASRFRPDAELSMLNAAADRTPGTAHPVSPLLAEALAAALWAAETTGGAVTPTVGAALVELGYDRDFALVDAQGPALRRFTRPAPAWRSVHLDRAAGRVTLPPGVRLDLGATAKALAADRAARGAAAAAGCGVLVSLGGDLATAGDCLDGGWPVRVTDDTAASLDGPVLPPGQTVLVRSGGLATSSTTVRRWRRGEASVHHLVDPWTGRPAGGPWRTVSVAAATCLDANVAATAAVVLGERALGWLAERRLPARLVEQNGTVRTVGPWPGDDPGEDAP